MSGWDGDFNPLPTCALCGAYSTFTMTSTGPRWERGCQCPVPRETPYNAVEAGAAFVRLRYRLGAS